MKAILVFVILIPFIAGAQSRISDHNSIGWYGVFITPKISEKTSGHLEYQWRRDNMITDWQQSLFRAGINENALFPKTKFVFRP